MGLDYNVLYETHSINCKLEIFTILIKEEIKKAPEHIIQGLRNSLKKIS
ncbi:hypothetical protein HMPREF3033_01059 [Veillonellaceae bacterium DNF00751]|nr:hypothetical protein HMPREF3033_01059 [Veillonellaceae bacterium DNF00751]DAR44881.1 MAG TPA: hypothetical protein [Caudoviricetes sp.]